MLLICECHIAPSSHHPPFGDKLTYFQPSSGILINVIGFAGAIGRDVPVGATYIYNLNYFCGFIISAAIYWALCKISPIPACSDHWLEVGDAIEDVHLAYQESVTEDRSGDIDKDVKMV